ncbi:MAG: DUF4345 family protein [Rhizobiaceae bacterium]|nr:DUF4345 family protein [Rhizobiaceae bacterium]
MAFAFPWPISNAEWIAFSVAAFTALLGLLFLFAPGLSMRILRLRTAEGHPEAQAELRGRMAGFYLGLPLCCILLGQPLLYLALGFSWLLVAFGRLISMLSDAGLTTLNFAWLVLEFVLAASTIAFALGWLA